MILRIVKNDLEILIDFFFFNTFSLNRIADVAYVYKDDLRTTLSQLARKKTAPIVFCSSIQKLEINLLYLLVQH